LPRFITANTRPNSVEVVSESKCPDASKAHLSPRDRFRTQTSGHDPQSVG